MIPTGELQRLLWQLHEAHRIVTAQCQGWTFKGLEPGKAYPSLERLAWDVERLSDAAGDVNVLLARLLPVAERVDAEHHARVRDAEDCKVTEIPRRDAA